MRWRNLAVAYSDMGAWIYIDRIPSPTDGLTFASNLQLTGHPSDDERIEYGFSTKVTTHELSRACGFGALYLASVVQSLLAVMNFNLVGGS